MRAMRCAAAVAALIGVVALCGGTSAASTAASGQPSSNVVVIPGFHAPKYSDTHGIPPFPANNSALSAYHFSELDPSAVTPAALASNDTVIIYGLRWADIPASAQQAINQFAATGKVMIWDADSTGAQDYDTFVHPFQTSASGESGGAHGSVVTFFNGTNPLASDDPSSPQYLDPAALIASNHLIAHMNVMHPGATGWSPALVATNTRLPSGGWVLAWGYGSTGDGSGMTIYSGMDADAFDDATSPNYAIKELSIELAAPFLRSASACAPNCSAPPTPSPSGGTSSGSGTGSGTGTGTGGTTGTGLGTPKSPTYAQCSFARRAPRGWVHGDVSLSLSTSIADGITGKALTRTGKQIGSGTTVHPGHLKLEVNTRLLPSNRRSKVVAVVYVNQAKSCVTTTELSVDNKAAKLSVLKVQKVGERRRIVFRVSEKVRLSVSVHGRRRSLTVSGYKRHTIQVAATATRVTFTMIDRAGNRSRRALTLH